MDWPFLHGLGDGGFASLGLTVAATPAEGEAAPPMIDGQHDKPGPAGEPSDEEK